MLRRELTIYPRIKELFWTGSKENVTVLFCLQSRVSYTRITLHACLNNTQVIVVTTNTKLLHKN